jgi:ankyrin repeat protein
MAEAGVNLEFADEDGDTALIHAATKNRSNAVRQLISHGAKIDAVNSKYVLGGRRDNEDKMRDGCLVGEE